MAETKITRCPHCQTTFRIRTEQLSAAQGAVRCGSCLQVFKAAENLILVAAIQPEKTEVLIKEAPACPEESFKEINNSKKNASLGKCKSLSSNESSNTKKTTDDFSDLIHDDMIEDSFINDEPPAASKVNSRTVEDISFDDIPDQISDDPLEDFGIQTADKKILDNDSSNFINNDLIQDEFTDENLMADAEINDKEDVTFDDIPDQIADDPMEDFGIRNTDIDINDNFNSGVQLDDSVFSMSNALSVSDSDGGFQFTDQFDTKEPTNYHDDSWASSLLEEDDAPTKKQGDDESWAEALLEVDDDLLSDIDAGNFYSKSDAKTRSNTHSNSAEKDNFVASLDDDGKSDGLQLSGNNDLEQNEVELSIADSVNDLHDEPLALNRLFSNKKKTKANQKQQQQYPIQSSYTWLWLSAAIVMLLVMILQISYFKFDTWSRHPDYRPVYGAVCELVGCKLPAIQDVKQMTTQHFMVRPHPEVKGALSIDTLLLNSAQYQQPFPDLMLVFTGLEDQVIASRRFKPQEYLAGELAGATFMPPKVPVHIAFEIINPGAEAVSYRIQLIANH